MPERKPTAETTETAPADEAPPAAAKPAAPAPKERPPLPKSPEERARAALTGERVTMTAAELEALLAGDAFPPDDLGEIRHLVRQNRILVEDR